MKKFTEGAGPIAALAALFAAVVTAAVMMAVRPVAAQSQPRLVVQTAGTASIGVSVRDVTADDAAKANLGQPAGVYIDSVREGSPAARAGVQASDIVIEFDGERVRSASHFSRLVQESVPSRQLAMIVVRGTSRQTLNVTPEASSVGNLLSGDARRRLVTPDLQLRDFNFNVDPNLPRRALPLSGRTLGVSVFPLRDQLAGYFGVKEGVLVSDVSSGSAAASAGVKAGDVITAINGQTVESTADIARALRESTSETVEITVMRDRKPQSLKATVPLGQNAPAGRSGRGLPV